MIWRTLSLPPGQLVSALSQLIFQQSWLLGSTHRATASLPTPQQARRLFVPVWQIYGD
jgi:hypothetical protein